MTIGGPTRVMTMHVLLVETGKNKGKRLKLPEGESIVGRDETAALRIASSEVSRQHCVITAKADGLSIRDLGSSNGTFVNGEAITGETQLKPGDLLMIGPMGFRVQGKLPGLQAGPRKAMPAKSAPDQGLSDDEIATWLGVGDETPGSGDTAVLAAPPPATQTPIPAPRKKSFKSVAEEAADIIRRHQALRAQQQ
jgi:pSer/pThr/pTyr-binding forkhead associated (FHA) protein